MKSQRAKKRRKLRRRRRRSKKIKRNEKIHSTSIDEWQNKNIDQSFFSLVAWVNLLISIWRIKRSKAWMK